MDSSKFFAVIPAAGRSRRMGTPKLMLPWKQHRVIDAVLKAWTGSPVDRIVVVARSDDTALKDACREWSVAVEELKIDTPDMKATVIAGIEHIAKRFSPAENDQLLIAPADLPGISSRLISHVIDAQPLEQIAVPFYGEKRGHPLRIPWRLTYRIQELNADQGLNALIDKLPIQRIQLNPELRLRDIDTPEDYRREFNSVRESSEES